MSKFSNDQPFEQRSSLREDSRGGGKFEKFLEQVHCLRSRGIAYVTIRPGGPDRQTYAVRSASFRTVVAQFLFTGWGEADSKMVGQLIDICEAQALHASEEREVYSRFARTPEGAYLDFVRGGQVAEMSADEPWRIVAESTIPFVRMSGMGPLPEPVRAEKGSVDALERLGLETEHADLMMSWAIGVLAGLEAPTLRISGQHAEWLVEYVRSILDPNAVPVIAVPRNVHDLIVHASNTPIVAFSVRRLPERVSDALLDVASGLGYGKRALYSDRDQVVYSSRPPLILGHAPDLDIPTELDMESLAVPWDSEGTSRREVQELFARDHPQILGHVLAGASYALRDPKRDFVAGVSQASEYFGWPEGYFQALYAESRKEAIVAALGAYPFVPILHNLAPFEGTATKLRELLNRDAKDGDRLSSNWPHNAQQLGIALRRLAPKLEATGLKVEHTRRPGNPRTRFIRLRRV